MKFEIYYEFYSSAQKKVVSKKIGIDSGISFKDVCYNHALNNPEFAKHFNLNNLTFKNHELCGNLL